MRTIAATLSAVLIALVETSAAAGEPADALDFDNGAFVLEQPESYASGIAAWSPWHLTDGSDDAGWCSREGTPKGGTFVWELDTTWRLDTLALSTRGVEEGEYPGIGVSVVELFVAPATGPWKSVGRFEVGKVERRQHGLPKGTKAARVKLVVVDNHGSASFSELSEVDLLGERVAPSPTRKIEGDFSTTYGPLRLVQEGDAIFGCYDWVPGAGVWGSMTGRMARVTWFEPGSGEGTATFAVSSSGDRIWGVYYTGGNLMGEWSGPRVPASEGPKCTPARKGQVEQSLARTGRVVLYGIRFDTASDVPRPESVATLEELLGVLAAKKELELTIEGHTDSTAGDAYNLELSNRRARAVVAWLVKRGVAAERLDAKGYGRTRPVADNATAQGRALNRRVEVAVTR